jgi:hypothetical protein
VDFRREHYQLTIFSLADTRILIFRRQLPPELTWDTDKVASYIAGGEEEPIVRRRLAIFIVDFPSDRLNPH